MNILFLGDLVGENCVHFLKKNLRNICVKYNINFVITNAENVAEGYCITPDISNNLFKAGVNVISTGNHVWDQKETVEHIEREKKLLRPYNLTAPSPGKGFEIFNSKNNFKVGVLNLMGIVFMIKCDDVFIEIEKILEKYSFQAFKCRR